MSSSEDEVEYEEEIFNIREHQFRLTTVSFMPLAKLMQMREEQVEISDFIAGCNVIELGAGTGCIGMLCRKLGCEQIWLTDHDVRSLTHMKKDLFVNSIEADVVALNWYDFDMSSYVSDPFFMNHKIRIVAGDVLYKNDLLVPFFTVVRSVLQLPDSKMLLCHVPRAGVDHDTVKSTASRYGLVITDIDATEWKKGVCFEYSIPDDYDRAQLYEISRAEVTR